MTVSRCFVHVWHIDLDHDASADPAVLSQAEISAGQGIKNAEARHLYMLTHMRLRQILGLWMNIDPVDVAFDTGWNGKPEIKGATGPSFSISHSGRRALIAVTHKAPLGIDIERQRKRKLDRKTAQRFFAPGEAAALKSLSDAAHARAFTRLWTFKEAFIKATGEGLARKLNSFEIDVSKPFFARCVSHSNWVLHDIATPSGYCGAIAVHTPHPVTIVPYSSTTSLEPYLAA